MIAYFVRNLDGYSGAAKQALLLAKYLKQDVLIFNHSNKEYNKYQENESITIVDLPKNTFLQLMFVFINTLRYKVKIYHFHGSFIFGLIIGALLNKKMIMKTTLLGDDDFDTYKKRKLWWIRLYLFKFLCKNIVLSENLKKINSRYINSSKIELIPNGVLTATYCPSLEDKKNIFCFVGFVCQRKRTYESIKYFIDHYSHLNNSKMYIVGPYNDMPDILEDNEAYVNSCFDLVSNHSMEDKIMFTGRVSNDEVQNVFIESKALIFLSSREGMPNVVLEAMASNCVPITSELDGVIREIFEDKKQGFILGDEFESIAINDINKIIENQEAFFLAKRRYNIVNIADRYREIYAEC